MFETLSIVFGVWLAILGQDIDRGSLERFSWSEPPVVVQDSRFFSRRRRSSFFRSRSRECYDTSDSSNPRSIPCPPGVGRNNLLIELFIVAVVWILGLTRRERMPSVTMRESIPAGAPVPPRRPVLKPLTGPGGKIGDLIRSYERSNPAWNYDEILHRAKESAELWFSGSELEPSQRIQLLRKVATAELLSREHQIPRVQALPQGAPTLTYARDQSSRNPPLATLCAKVALAAGRGQPALYSAELWFTLQGGRFWLSEVTVRPA